MSSLLNPQNQYYFEKAAAGPVGVGTKIFGFLTNAFGKAPANALRSMGRSMKGFTGKYTPDGKILNGTVKGDSWADKVYGWGQSILDKNNEIIKATGGKGYNPIGTAAARIGAGALGGGALTYGGYSLAKNKIEDTVANHAYNASVQTAQQLLAAMANRPWYERLYNVFNPSGFKDQALQAAIPAITDMFTKQMEERGHANWKPEALLKQ